MSNKTTTSQPHYCCITQCKNYKKPNANVELYPLPQESWRREKACEILGIPQNVGMNDSSRVCALHFKSKVGLYQTSSIYKQAPSVEVSKPATTVEVSHKPFALFVDDRRRLNFTPILPKIPPIMFPTPLQQPTILHPPPTLQQSITLQQPITLTFNPGPISNIHQHVILKESPEDLNTNSDKIDNNEPSKEENKPRNSSEVTLQLECEEDVLSSTQLNAYMKDLMDFVNASELVHKLPAPEYAPFENFNDLELVGMPPLESLLKNTPMGSSPVTLSSSASQFVNIASPSTKGINVASNPISLLKNAVNNLPKVETTDMSSSSTTTLSTQPLYANSPLLTSSTTTSLPSLPLSSNSPVFTPSTVSSTITDKDSAVSNLNEKQSGNSSVGGKLPANGLLPQSGQMPTVATLKLNSNILPSGSNPRPQTATSTSLPSSSGGGILYDLVSFGNSSPASTLSKNPPGTQQKPVYQILPELLFKYKIVNAATSANSAIPVMLLKSLESTDVAQPSKLNTSSASNSPLTILGKESDETETSPASLCNVTLEESSDEVLHSLGQTISNNDQSPELNPTSGSPMDNTSVGIGVESLSYADETQFCSSVTDRQIGPVIVDVISAKEGATEYFNANRIPNILLDKSKKPENSNSSSHTSTVGRLSKPKMDKIIFNTLDRMYSVNTKDSIFSLQKSIPVIANGYQPIAERSDLLRLKTPMPIKRSEEAENLRKRLRQEHFIHWSVWWLIQRRYIPLIKPCNFCGSKKFVVEENSKFPDGFCWTCANSDCPVQKPIKRPTFFDQFKLYSITDLLLLTYHWACQSSFEEITQDLDMDSDKIWYFFKALQELCYQVVLKKGKLGLSHSSMVEVAAVKMGDVFILGGMDRKTRYVRLETLTETEAYVSSSHISQLDKWMHKNSKVVTENKINDSYIPHIRKFGADHSVTDPNSNLPHILNISRYLAKNLATIFGTVNQHLLKINDIQGFIYELQWRVKYGKFVDMSFWSILNHIRDLNIDEGSDVQVKKAPFSCDAANTTLSIALSARWGPAMTELERIYKPQKPLNQKFKLSGKDTKSYSKDATNVSVRDYFQDVPEIHGGTAMVTSKALLAVKIRFGESPADMDLYKSDAISLGLKLKNEGFINNPIKWLVQKGFVKNISPCYVCQAEAFLKESSRFNDGCSWVCQNEKCEFENVFRRPSFFARFPQYPMSHVAGMIFHWIVQSDESLINLDVPMDSSKILDVWRTFQGLCASALKRKKEKLGGFQHMVEVALVKFGKLYVLGAMDRQTQRSFLQVFPPKFGKINTFYHTLNFWILTKSTIIIDATTNFKFHEHFDGYKIVPAVTSIVDRNDPGYHVLNIETYLLKYLSNMFGHLKSDFMRQEIMQSYLEELVWREKYGREPQEAFTYMMNEIFYNDLRYKFDFSLQLKDPEFIPVKFKELRVVLRKIPKSVLKFYGCELPDSSKTSKGPTSTLSKVIEEEPSNLEHDVSDDTSPHTVQYSNQRLEGSDDEVTILDPVRTFTNTLENQNNMLQESPKCESTSTFITGESCTNKVQPLVIKMHKKRKKFRSYLKSELEKAKKIELEKGLKNGGLDVPNSDLHVDLDKREYSLVDTADILSSDSSDSNSWETQSTDSVKLCKKVAKKTVVSRSSSVQKEEEPMSVASDSSHSNTWETQSTDSINSTNRVVRKRLVTLHSSSSQKEKVPMCIECGEPADAPFEHFMKQFNCTDCKSQSIYTTSCSKSFFEHRGSILFGKRMPRRKKEDYGLHRPITMPSPWHCACGFNTKNGNRLASHMVKCRKMTCYYHQNVL